MRMRWILTMATSGKLPEPEALDLPDDLNLDSEDKDGDGDTGP